MHDNGFDPIFLKVHSAKLDQLMYQSDLGNKVNLLGACIRFDLGYINEYEFGSYGFQSWLGLIKMLGYFSYRDQQNILLKLKREICSLLLFRIIFSNKEESFLVMQGNQRTLSNLNPRLRMII